MTGNPLPSPPAIELGEGGLWHWLPLAS